MCRWVRQPRLVIFAAVLFICCGGSGSAHEVRPAYLELTEQAPATFAVLFKTPMLGELRLALTVIFSGPVQPVTPVLSRVTGDAMVQTWQVRTSAPLRGQDIRIAGLESTVTDALVRIAFLDGRSWTQRLTPAAPQATVPASQSWD